MKPIRAALTEKAVRPQLLRTTADAWDLALHLMSPLVPLADDIGDQGQRYHEEVHEQDHEE